jgi:hypothetical protein
LIDRALREVTRDEHVREGEGIRAGDLDLALHADVPEGDAVQELPVLLYRIAVVARVVHVVVEAVHLDAVPARRVEERRPADPRVEQHLRVVVDGAHLSSL